MSDVRRILVPLDQTPLGEAKLPVAMEQARAFDAEVLLLHVLPLEAIDSTGAVSPEEARARTYLENVATKMRGEGVVAHALVRSGSAAATIVDEATERGATLIVLGANVRPSLPRAFLGSVADEVVRRAPCPVLLVRPRLDAGSGSVVRSFDEDAAQLGPLSRRSLGLRTVEVSRITGSVGRAHTLGAAFRPKNRSREDEQRYTRVQRAMEEGRPLPPVELYKLGFGYYVLDGNHRVAVARQLGQVEIDADVTEFIPLGDLEAQRTFAERRAFERATGLTRVEAANSASYHRLEGLIAAFSAEAGVMVPHEAARRWYYEVFRPTVKRLRLLGVARLFPGERSADIIVRLADYKHAEEERLGRPLTWDEAVDALAHEHGLVSEKSREGRPLGLIGRR